MGCGGDVTFPRLNWKTPRYIEGKFQGLPIMGSRFLYYSHKNPLKIWEFRMGPADLKVAS